MKHSQSKSQQAAPSSADLRQVRQSLGSLLESLRAVLSSGLTAQQAEQLAAALAQGETLLQQLGDAAGSEQLAPVVPPLNYGSASLAELTDTAIARAAETAQPGTIDIDVVRPHNSPKTVIVDSERLQQALQNLLAGAIRHGTGIAISLSIRVDQSSAEIAVPEALAQASATTPSSLAMLRLSIEEKGVDPESKAASRQRAAPEKELLAWGELCSFMGGKLEQQDAASAGFSLEMAVPCAVPLGGGEAIDQARSVDSRSLPESQSVRSDLKSTGLENPLAILMAEDSEINRLLLLAQLDQLGYRADVAANGEEVLRALKVRPYDVVLMDIRMPVLDGFATSRRLRADKLGPQPYLIAVTGSDHADEQGEFDSAGIDAYLPKPVDLAQLADALSLAFEKKQQQSVSTTTAEKTAAGSDTAAELELESLYAQLGPAADKLLRRVIPVFIREFPARREGLKEAFARGDTGKFAALCHSLKGSCRSVGATRLAAEFAGLEKQSYGGSLPEAGQLETLIELSAQAIRALNAELARLTPTATDEP